MIRCGLLVNIAAHLPRHEKHRLFSDVKGE